jgi:hypothetical protein
MARNDKVDLIDEGSLSRPRTAVSDFVGSRNNRAARCRSAARPYASARSGQTGNVNAPQLHFEIRKGTSPLDPRRFLTLDGMHA